jgi:hypothetical protein
MSPTPGFLAPFFRFFSFVRTLRLSDVFPPPFECGHLWSMALDAGFDRTYISLIERGINSPTIRTVVKIAGMLKVAPSKIVVRMEQFLAGAKE